MKFISASLLLVLIATLWSCHEVPPTVDFKSPEIFLLEKSTKTVSESDRPSAQMKNVLIEDITGVSCVNCPAAADRAKSIQKDNPGRVVVVGLYTTLFPSLSDPVYLGDRDLRTKEAGDIHSILYDGNPLPAGGVNRKKFDVTSGINQRQIFWTGTSNMEFKLLADANITASLAWVNDSTVDLNAEIFYNQTLEHPVYFTVMLIENGITATQKKLSTPPDGEYVHNHILRKMYTPYFGKLLQEEANLGTQTDVKWRVYLPDFVDLSNAALVFFIHHHTESTEEVIQVVELPL